MTITLTSKEFDEAVSLWLEDQGFSPDSYNITTRVIAGRSDGPLGTRLEVTLDAKPREIPSGPIPRGGVFESMSIPTPADVVKATSLLHDIATSSFSQRASQGHADE